MAVNWQFLVKKSKILVIFRIFGIANLKGYEKIENFDNFWRNFFSDFSSKNQKSGHVTVFYGSFLVGIISYNVFLTCSNMLERNVSNMRRYNFLMDLTECPHLFFFAGLPPVWSSFQCFINNHYILKLAQLKHKLRREKILRF